MPFYRFRHNERNIILSKLLLNVYPLTLLVPNNRKRMFRSGIDLSCLSVYLCAGLSVAPSLSLCFSVSSPLCLPLSLFLCFLRSLSLRLALSVSLSYRLSLCLPVPASLSFPPLLCPSPRVYAPLSVRMSVGRPVGWPWPISLACVYILDGTNRSPASWTSSTAKPLKPVRVYKQTDSFDHDGVPVVAGSPPAIGDGVVEFTITSYCDSCPLLLSPR